MSSSANRVTSPASPLLLAKVSTFPTFILEIALIVTLPALPVIEVVVMLPASISPPATTVTFPALPEPSNVLEAIAPSKYQQQRRF
ncbi:MULTISPECIES: hypothetical protein [Pseudanabaena]|uniref:Uncharacterized protein n=1 Tax=Pseudanabaena catenata USMAC16 TaxID=1855837 RepID=A0A9X4RKG5_9CYAN|nr:MULTISPECIES: hypothetical protein [Pseudanabaena]MDG3497025.1 hypothetical protein [Pseudanabaena catenata USMAC16]